MEISRLGVARKLIHTLLDSSIHRCASEKLYERVNSSDSQVHSPTSLNFITSVSFISVHAICISLHRSDNEFAGCWLVYSAI